jgi:MSHA biogenesis protein MshG
MPRFSYKGRDRSGSLVSGQVQAASANEAATDLLNESITPIDITEFIGKKRDNAANDRDMQKKSQGFGAGFFREKISLVELIIFSRQMFSLMKAGIPLDRALRGLRDSVSSLELKKVLNETGQQLEKGMTLTDSLGRHPEVFSPLYLSLVHVGENTGRLDQSFQQVGKYLELERETTKQVKSATRYPIFVMITIAIALSIIMVFVIPVFAETFARLGAELPWQTRVLISISDFTVAYWYYILGALAAAFFAFKHYVGTASGRKKWDEQKLKIPLVGNIFERVALSRFSRTFAMMMNAGVPIVQSLSVIARAVGNTYIGDNIIGIRESISKGESLYLSAVKSGMFTPLVLQMISVGEESGSLGDLLDEVADFYDSEVEYDLKRLSAAIEPILIVCIAGMVLILALGVFLPIWDLASAVR